MVTGEDIAAFMGRSDDAETIALADQTIPVITAMARAYTRGQGFQDGQPNEELAAVITTATAAPRSRTRPNSNINNLQAPSPSPSKPLSRAGSSQKPSSLTGTGNAPCRTQARWADVIRRRQPDAAHLPTKGTLF